MHGLQDIRHRLQKHHGNLCQLPLYEEIRRRNNWIPKFGEAFDVWSFEIVLRWDGQWNKEHRYLKRLTKGKGVLVTFIKLQSTDVKRFSFHSIICSVLVRFDQGDFYENRYTF